MTSLGWSEKKPLVPAAAALRDHPGGRSHALEGFIWLNVWRDSSQGSQLRGLLSSVPRIAVAAAALRPNNIARRALPPLRLKTIANDGPGRLNEAKGKTTCQRMNYRRESGIEIESSGNRSMPRTWPKAVAWITEVTSTSGNTVTSLLFRPMISGKGVASLGIFWPLHN
ncbi:hypothetical protein B0H14DRAFT_2604250 [Mycena olivaceomarginata]|nr:hypothetical protein B0H14DRAFT_2604250 [Mycena olivaceomarginata]